MAGDVLTASSELRAWAAAHAGTVGRTGEPLAGQHQPLTTPPPTAAVDELVVDGRLHSTLAGHTKRVWSVAFVRLGDGQVILASGSDDGTVRLWDPQTSEQLRTLTHPDEVNAAAFAVLPDGRVVLATGCDDSIARIWELIPDPSSPEPVAPPAPAGAITTRDPATLTGHTGLVLSVAAVRLADGQVVLASGSDDGTVRLWDPQTGEQLRTLTGHTGWVWSVAAVRLADGQVVLASGSGDGTVRLWDPQTRDPATLTGHTGSVWSVAAVRLADGQVVLASGSRDGTVRLWDPQTGEHLRTLTGHTGWVRSVAAVRLADGQVVLASGSGDGTVRLWDPQTSEQLRTLTHPDEVNAVAFAVLPDGRVVLATGCDDSIARIWELVTPHAASGRGMQFVRPGVVGGELRACAVGLVALSGVGLSPPLSLLTDLVAVVGGRRPDDDRLRSLVDHPGVERLQGLGWPLAARPGLAALLAADLPFDPLFVAPAASPRAQQEALLAALASPVGAPVRPDLPVEVLHTAADGVSDQTVTLLSVLGSQVVTADPTLPLRLRDRAVSVPALDVHHRGLLAESAVAATVRPVGAHTGTTAHAPGTSGITRKGTLASLLPTQLALPGRVLALRHARHELLYRLYEDHAEPRLEPVTLVLDTTPPTFGPVEQVLRLVAHAATVTLWAAGANPTLVTLDLPGLSRRLEGPSDLVAIWAARTVRPPALAVALAAAGHVRNPVVVVLTHHHLAREHPLLPSATCRLLTTHAPGDPPSRPVVGPYHVHLPPQPSSAQVSRAVQTILAPQPH